MIEVSDLTVNYGKLKALDAVSFKIPDGKVVGFVGVNGAGKTTTIKVASGVLKPSSGTVLIDGLDVVREKAQASRNLGWVPELPTYEQGVKAMDYFVYLAGYYGLSGAEAKKVGQDLFQQLGLLESSKKRLKEYSQGMKKRFALAVSLLNDPHNFLMDEVMNGLDPQGIAFFRDKTVEFRKQGKAVLFSSHILSEVQSIADEVVFIHKGKILAVKGMDEILSLAQTSGVRVTLSNPDARVADILSSYGEVKDLGKGSYEVAGPKANPEDLNSVLVQQGYKVSGIERVTGNLESYFFKLIGEQQ
ncbi:MAG: ABC transporter ATP-binding protein [TACK group archaeon]|nr:ABC transporter ATP-binding protein [TACK group archaeon]